MTHSTIPVEKIVISSQKKKPQKIYIIIPKCQTRRYISLYVHAIFLKGSMDFY